MIQASIVPKEHVDAVWKDVEGYLKGAADYTYGRFDVDDIYDSIVQYDSDLWIAFEVDGDILGAVVTRFVDYPRKRFLSMDFTGGVQLKKWKQEMLELLQKWAYDNYCEGIESAGRPGWGRIFSKDGYKLVFHTYELPVADAGLGARNG